MCYEILNVSGSRVSKYPIPREFMVPSLDSSRNGRKVKRYVHCSVVREMTEPRGGPGGIYKPRGSARLEASHRGQCKSREPRQLRGGPGERGSGTNWE